MWWRHYGHADRLAAPMTLELNLRGDVLKCSSRYGLLTVAFAPVMARYVQFNQPGMVEVANGGGDRCSG
jgi:hypothetical protein